VCVKGEFPFITIFSTLTLGHTPAAFSMVLVWLLLLLTTCIFVIPHVWRACIFGLLYTQ
jgi:hypothetical protein